MPSHSDRSGSSPATAEYVQIDTSTPMPVTAATPLSVTSTPAAPVTVTGVVSTTGGGNVTVINTPANPVTVTGVIQTTSEGSTTILNPTLTVVGQGASNEVIVSGVVATGPTGTCFSYNVTQLIDSSGADNLSADVTSAVVSLDRVRGLGVEAHVDNTVNGTKTATGKLYFQVSNSQVNWNDISLSNGLTYLDVTSGNDADAHENFTDLEAEYFRVFYDRTSGDGILDVYIRERKDKR